MRRIDATALRFQRGIRTLGLGGLAVSLEEYLVESGHGVVTEE
jgi:hypothetical protein